MLCYTGRIPAGSAGKSRLGGPALEEREEIKNVIAKNISALRTGRGLTQLDLAEALHYSDKAVSKWERGESLPDITVLVQIADLFHVPLQYLVESSHETPATRRRAFLQEARRNHAFIIGISVFLVFLIATLVFVVLQLTQGPHIAHVLSFVIAVPVALIVWLVLNSVWFSRRLNFVIISCLMWSVLAAVFLCFLAAGLNIWMVFLLGIPGQIIILLASRLQYREHRYFWRQKKQQNTEETENGTASSDAAQA